MTDESGEPTRQSFRPLTPKQQRFAEEYIVDLNATQAAIRAGYSRGTARQIAAENLSKPNISTAIEKLIAAQSKRTQITADVVLGELLRLARADIADAFTDLGALKPIHEIPEDVRRAISGIEVDEITEKGDAGRAEVVGYTRKVKFWDKKGALELLGRHLRLFVDKIEHSGADGAPLIPTIVQVNLVSPGPLENNGDSG